MGNAGPFNNGCYAGEKMYTECRNPQGGKHFPNRTQPSPMPSPAPRPMPTPTPMPMPSPSPTPTPEVCHAISPVVDDAWCVSNCASGFCPSDLCECDGSRLI